MERGGSEHRRLAVIRALRERGGALILVAGLAASFVVCMGPIYNPDLSWHLAA